MNLKSDMPAKGPTPCERPISFVLTIGMILVAGLLYVFLYAGAITTLNEVAECRARVKHLESTVDGQIALDRARKRPPIGYNLDDPCSRRDYLESQIR